MAEKKEMGVIAEEALDEIAGGLSISKEKVKSALKTAGVALVGVGTLAAGGYAVSRLFGSKVTTEEIATHDNNYKTTSDNNTEYTVDEDGFLITPPPESK